MSEVCMSTPIEVKMGEDCDIMKRTSGAYVQVNREIFVGHDNHIVHIMHLLPTIKSFRMVGDSHGFWVLTKVISIVPMQPKKWGFKLEQMQLLDLIGPRHLMSTCNINARSDENNIVVQCRACDIPSKRLIANYISCFKMVKLNESYSSVNFMGMLCITPSTFVLRALSWVIGDMELTSSSNLQTSKFVKTLNNVGISHIIMRKIVIPMLWLMVDCPPSSNTFGLNRWWVLHATIIIIVYNIEMSCKNSSFMSVPQMSSKSTKGT